jgi:hypothetical protein
VTVPSARAAQANRVRSLKFRKEVIEYLQAHGFADVASASGPRGVSVAERLQESVGDLTGLDPWVVSVRARESTFDLAAGLDSVRWIAENAASPYFAMIQTRRQRPEPEQAVVVMTLGVFARVLLLLEALRTRTEDL